jgi:hypothetical protein
MYEACLTHMTLRQLATTPSSGDSSHRAQKCELLTRISRLVADTGPIPAIAISPLKMKMHLNYISRFNSYRAVNILTI